VKVFRINGIDSSQIGAHRSFERYTRSQKEIRMAAIVESVSDDSLIIRTSGNSTKVSHAEAKEMWARLGDLSRALSNKGALPPSWLKVEASDASRPTAGHAPNAAEWKQLQSLGGFDRPQQTYIPATFMRDYIGRRVLFPSSTEALD
jgi:hypothetical protein